jgi:dCMP deaminase
MKRKFKLFYMNEALNVAKLSYCNKLQVGAVLVKDNRIISFGYNGTFSGEDNCCEDADGKTKDNVIHAEENLLMKLTRTYETAVGSSIFITHQPCINCARLIANSGVTEVFYAHDYRCNRGTDLLDQRNIYTEQFSLEDLQEIKQLFNK